MRVPRSTFERLVVQALDDLPETFLEALDNIDVVVEQEPSPDQLADAGIEDGTLLGLYEGVPRTERTTSYGMVVPDKITIFQGPISRLARSEDDIREIVQETVVHEIAHHFGISDERLRELGVY